MAGETTGEERPMTDGDLNRAGWIRISCASLCRIERDGRYLLLLNHNRREKGLYILSAIGGALTASDPGIFARFGASPEEPGTNDLRMLLPLNQLEKFRAWFYSGDGRERSPYRELYEELVIESRLLQALEPDHIACRYLWTIEDRRPTERQGQTGLITQYFLEVFDITFTSVLASVPLRQLPPGSGAAWVTAEQIASRSTVDLHVDGGIHAAEINAEPLLKPPDSASPAWA
jgi:hypothetical protein